MLENFAVIESMLLLSDVLGRWSSEPLLVGLLRAGEAFLDAEP